MSGLRGTSVVSLAVAAVALSGCGAPAPQATDGTTATPTQTSTPTLAPTTSSTPLVLPSAGATRPTPTATPTRCAQDAIPDGTWAGPITMRIRGNGNRSGYAASTGTGRLQVTVANGSVTSGRWRVTWKSVGHADTGQAVASLTLAGRISGTLHGPATKPVLPASWRLHGTVIITKPVHDSAPVEETGTDLETMKVASTSCDAVTGTFLPSITSKNAAVTFHGTARWVGTREH